MIRVQAEDFDIGAEIARLTAGKTGIGGVASFIGLVRDRGPAEGGLKAMTLEHYPGMTERELARIEAEAWGAASSTASGSRARCTAGNST